jgi:hypothetical protein
VARLFGGVYQVFGVSQEALTGRRQRRSSSAPVEKYGSELTLESLYSGADGGLGYMEAICGTAEVTGSHHGKEGTREFGVHVNNISKISILSTN